MILFAAVKWGIGATVTSVTANQVPAFLLPVSDMLLLFCVRTRVAADAYNVFTHLCAHTLQHCTRYLFGGVGASIVVGDTVDHC